VEPSLNQIEEEVRRFWERDSIPDMARAVRRDGPSYVIYQQPLPVVGGRWIDLVRLLCTSDLLARYHSMKGKAVCHQAGWGCHGLPVEVAVERSLEPNAANYDLAQFNAACRSAADTSARQVEDQAHRLGVWLDPACTCATLTPRAIGAVWGALHQLSDLGRLKREHRIAPVCPRCGTPLSAAEAGRLTSSVEAQAAWVHLPWDGEPGTYLLAWTPDPWMLVGMVAVAVHPDANYAVVEVERGDAQPSLRLLLAESALAGAIKDDHRPVQRIGSRALRGSRYRPPFTYLPAGEGTNRVILSKRVPLGQGTGVLPVTPAFDSLSLRLAQEHRLPMPEPLDEEGRLDDRVGRWRGLRPMDAEPFVLDDLEARGLLFKAQTEQRSRAQCPYCETPLLPMARSVWQVETGKHPWIVGRDRSWGTPLPIWTCGACSEQVCLAGLDDLAHRTGQIADQFDPHRPDVDRITFPCSQCGGTMRRVTVVVDADFEAAVLPWATALLPGAADIAVGLDDGSPGWLDAMTELTTLLRNSPAWEESLPLPQGIGGDGWELGRATPADALRWAIYTDTTPEEAERNFLRPLWQMVSRATRPIAQAPTPDRQEGAGQVLLDRWLLARLHQATEALTGALNDHDPRRAAEELGAFVDEVSRWYLPRRPEGGRDALGTLCGLAAPFVPHLAEAIYRRIDGRSEGSVHVTAWPAAELTSQDEQVLVQMALVQRLGQLGRAVRSEAGIDQDLPLTQALVGILSGGGAPADRLAPYTGILAAELGVGKVQVTPEAASHVGWHLVLHPDRVVKSDADLAEIGGALEKLGAERARTMASQLLDGLSVSVEADGRAFTLLPEEIIVTLQPEPGWAAAVEGAYLVILETG
jgi:isoleucyl-tRNA synthetase